MTRNGKPSCTLLGVRIDLDRNDRGERRYLVTPTYRLAGGHVVTIPDGNGWPTLAEARAEAARLAGVPAA